MTSSIHIIGSRYSGGAETFFARLVNALLEDGHSVGAITRKNSMVAKELAPGVWQSHVGMYNVRDPVSRLLISRIIGSREPDIVQTYMGRGTRLTRVPKGKRTLHISRLGGFYKLDGYRHADAWVGNTKGICDYLIENRFPADRVFKIPNFVETGGPPDPVVPARMRKELEIPDGAIVILGVGRFIEKKGFADLLEAYNRLPETLRGRQVHLLLVGSGPEESNLLFQASQFRGAERIHWAGWQADTSPYYSLADVFVCPSHHEPLGNVILEAWAHSLPVVSTRTHGAIELIQEEINGLLVPCGDPATMSAVLTELLLGDENAMADLGREGSSLLDAKYSKDIIVKSYSELYDHLIAIER